MSDLKDIECWECKEKFKEFLSFRVHLWFKHTTTYGSTIYPKDLEKCGKVLVDKEHLEFLMKYMTDEGIYEYYYDSMGYLPGQYKEEYEADMKLFEKIKTKYEVPE